MCKQNTSNNSFKNDITNKLFAYKSDSYKPDLELNNLLGLICHKTTTSQLKIAYSTHYSEVVIHVITEMARCSLTSDRNRYFKLDLAVIQVRYHNNYSLVLIFCQL